MTGVSDGAQRYAGNEFKLRWWHGAFAAFTLVLVGLALFVTIQPIQVLPRMTLAPGYHLTDQNGQKFTSEDVRGVLTLYNFTYTGCGEGCPETGSTMRRIQDTVQSMDTAGIPVRLVTVSFDPAHDDPAALRAWAESHGANPDLWTVATGDPVLLKSMIGAGFSTYYAQNDDGSFTFDPTFVLVDGNGILRMTYKTAAPDPQIIERDINLLVNEVTHSSGATKLAYEAAHLFLCYPK